MQQQQKCPLLYQPKRHSSRDCCNPCNTVSFIGLNRRWIEKQQSSQKDRSGAVHSISAYSIGNYSAVTSYSSDAKGSDFRSGQPQINWVVWVWCRVGLDFHMRSNIPCTMDLKMLECFARDRFPSILPASNKLSCNNHPGLGYTRLERPSCRHRKHSSRPKHSNNIYTGLFAGQADRRN